MKSALQELIGRWLPMPGVAAWAARQADGEAVFDSYTDWFAPAQIEQTFGSVLLAAKSLTRHRIQPLRLCWVFDHARIHFATRSDGHCLALFVENRPDLPADAITGLLEEFLALPEI
ncbi:MAG: hypothetical protein EXS35_08290 [Pedosphaera sp.]|nr:hypothetical protein [Pedosphaera sp.]